MSKMAESMSGAAQLAKKYKKVYYLYHYSNDQLVTSYFYWKDWIFRVYPGGRKELRPAGLALLDERERELVTR